jgi:hypothetical protein
MVNQWPGKFSGHEEGRGEPVAVASHSHTDLLRDLCLFGAGFVVAMMIGPVRLDRDAIVAHATQTIACNEPYRQVMQNTVVQQMLGLTSEDCVEAE